MQIYYFTHLTAMAPDNTGIQRVVRGLGVALQRMHGVSVCPVTWSDEYSAVIHAEDPVRVGIQRFHGPVFAAHPRAGEPVHLDKAPMHGVNWLLVPEAPHLLAHDERYPSVNLPHIIGYARRHGLKVACVFHDILPLSHFGAARTNSIEALKFMVYATGLANADLVAPVSRSAGDDLLNWFVETGVDTGAAGRVRPLLLPQELTNVPRASRRSVKAADAPIEFCMWGAVIPHKNQIAVIDAFSALIQVSTLDLRLHVVGRVHPKLVHAISQAVGRSKGRIVVHGFANDAEMAAIIKRCRASIFLSRAEGYGLPVAESLWMGKPCITSNIGPMTEIAEGGGCLLVDPTSPSDIAEAIWRMATDDSLAAALEEQALNRPLSTWAEYARELVQMMSLSTPISAPTLMPTAASEASEA